MPRWKKEHVTGKIGGLKCLEPAGRQKTNDDDDDQWVSLHTSKNDGPAIRINLKFSTETDKSTIYKAC